MILVAPLIALAILWLIYKFWIWALSYADQVDKYLDERAEYVAESKTAEATRSLEDMVGFTEDEVTRQRQFIDGEAS